MRGSWGLLTGRMPRQQPGQPVATSTLNAALSTLERARPMPGSGTDIEVQQHPGGVALRLVSLLAAILQADGQVTARSGATYGTGYGFVLHDDGTQLVAGAGRRPVKNLLNKKVNSGSYMICVRALKSFWVIAVGDCSNLTAP